MIKAKNNPDFNRIISVLNRQKKQEPVLFEFFLNKNIYEYFTGKNIEMQPGNIEKLEIIIDAYYKTGYDFVIIPSWLTDTLAFQMDEILKKDTRSLNEGKIITDEKSFEKYPWPDPKNDDYAVFQELKNMLPDGMKCIATLPGGVLENVIDLVGFERLCFMTLENPELCKQIFDAVGTCLRDYYRIVASFDHVGALFTNDDWGFKTQTMLPPESMREFVFPWHKAMVEVIHQNNKPAILHSCGNLNAVMNEVIDDMKFDGKHSFEDGIVPVEQAYENWGDQIAIMGGFDVDFLARKSPEEIKTRAQKMLEITFDKGGFALGSGNSIPEYIPLQNFLALISAVNELRL